MIASCVICGAPLSLGNKLLGAFSTPTRGRCLSCASASKAALERFRADFNAACASGTPQPEAWNAMWQRLRMSPGISPQTWREDALNFIEAEAKHVIERFMGMAYADGIITREEDTYFEQLLSALLVDAARAFALRSRWMQFKNYSDVRQGNLPVVPTSFHLDAGEICHFHERAHYVKQNAKGVVMVPGQLLATSKRVHFLAADSSGWTIQYDKIMRLTAQTGMFGQGSLTFELSVKRGGGTYNLANAEWGELVLTTIIRIHRRQLLPGSGASRHISQDVKNAVWQRDAGRCVQCGAGDYLEFDHIIPHSKGGASTLGNVQLLCRRCNNQKSDRI